jgi:cyclophilin family peptidyl-prolyl cis-trans isomerase/HEAT repeat protein
MHKSVRQILFATVLVASFAAAVAGQPAYREHANPQVGVPANILLQIIRAEDERRWDDGLRKLLAHPDAKVRKRAALAAGRIANEGAVPPLTEMLLTDRDTDVRQVAAFALGEIESPGGAYALVEVLKRQGTENGVVRARAVEALGKIVAAMTSSTPAPADAKAPKSPEDDRLDIMRAAIVDTLRFENSRRSRPDHLTILLALTAVLRAKPDGVGKLVAEFLDYSDPRIVADALNTLARLRLKDGNDKARELLVKHSDPIVRANAARMLGAAEDKQAFEALLDRALHDSDERVVVSAIRALGSLKDARATQPLIERGNYLLKLLEVSKQFQIEPRNELLEIATTIGILLKDSRSEDALQVLRHIRAAVSARAPEVEIAMARVNPEFYVTEEARFGVGSPASLAQGLSEIAKIKKTNPAVDKASKFVPFWIHDLLNCKDLPPDAKSNFPRGRKCFWKPIAVSPLLQAYAAFGPEDLDPVLRQQLNEKDVIIRSTAAELIGERPFYEPTARALIGALPRAMRDVDNDAALAILDALAKQKNKEANDAIKTALDAKDHLIRRRAVALLKANGVGDFSDRIGAVQTRNTEADYRRAIARIGKKPTATVVTSKGSFTIEFLPEEAPLTVDNFIQLAKKRFFNGQTIPRVVPNFVVQAGDPRGDQNGGPGYTIRCEINEAPYERAAVGMALSGKDTGGSQWFATHSPQPHLDGGYTVFGRVIRGMDVVDKTARGDRIVRVIVNEK